MTLIDTPGLIFEAESSDDASLSNTGSNPGEKTRDRIESMVLELVQPSNRLIVCVEQAQGWGSCKMPSFMSKVDPSSYRTTYVYTNFYNNVLKVLASSQETNRYLGNQPAPRSTFFVSLFSAYMRQSSKKSFGELVVAAFQRDHQQLEHVRYNKTYAHAIGLPAFRSHLVERTRKQYLDTIPKLCKYFDGLRLNATTKLQHLQHSLSELESHRLRSVATTYVMEFLHVLSKLISGSAEALPSINGETSFDEQAVVGEWVNGKKEVIEVEESWGVSYLTNKLYGGQQFERLLSEFVAVCDHSRPIQPSVDDVANASGGKAMKEFSQYAWTVSEIVQRHAQTELYPLIEQLLDRALHVFVRLFPIAEVLVATHRKAKAAGKRSPLVQLDAAFDDEAQPELGGDLYGVSSGGAVGGSKKELLSTTSLEDLPYFHQRLREFYLNFVNRCAQICREKCVDEFCSTRIIYWELSSFPSKSLRIKNTQSAKQSRDKVGQLAVALWDQIKQRTSHNIALKCHHFFLVPMETELAGELQGQFSSLSDGEVEELFEVDTLRKALQKEKKQVEEALARHEAKEKAFRQAAALFSSRKH
ncbi:Dynamin family protein (Fragment), variant 3 [Balamuthia mandrillaris]